MKTVRVELAHAPYDILIAPGLLDRLYEVIEPDASAVVIVSNETVAPLYLERAIAALKPCGCPLYQVILPDGETYKDWATLNKIFDALLGWHCDRRVILLALGGGVIGDMTGFAASVYMRGVRFVQVPTTLLAQVDSSVGGKTAINHPLGKNMLGAFHQPCAVLIDPETLYTLPTKEVSAGLAEVVKHGLILDAPFFAWCEQNMSALRALDRQAISYAVARSCEIKAAVVVQDERETGLRALLNFGHTFAHAIEAGVGYGQWLHGHAVACGMALAAELSQALGWLGAQEVSRIKNIVLAMGCPLALPELSAERLLELMQVDKKAESGAIRFILLKALGQAIVYVPELAQVKQVLIQHALDDRARLNDSIQ